VGMKHMRLKERGKGLHRKQALAAIGQGKLITLWDQLFSQLDQPIAQILLTRQDISDVSLGRKVGADGVEDEVFECSEYVLGVTFYGGRTDCQ
jgi:glutamate 5-kinase